MKISSLLLLLCAHGAHAQFRKVGTVTGFKLVSAPSGTVISDLPEGKVIYLNNTTPALTVVATFSGRIRSVKMGFNTNANYRTENTAPYTLCGGFSYAACKDLVAGKHTVTATPRSGKAVKVSFELVAGFAPGVPTAPVKTPTVPAPVAVPTPVTVPTPVVVPTAPVLVTAPVTAPVTTPVKAPAVPSMPAVVPVVSPASAPVVTPVIAPSTPKAAAPATAPKAVVAPATAPYTAPTAPVKAPMTIVDPPVPTKAQTKAPVAPVPTKTPTNAPVNVVPSPTKVPTNAPVNVVPSPTKDPTNAPINVVPSPTKDPTNAPINVAPSPTKDPTNAPVNVAPSPTKDPTNAPINVVPSPTKIPTNAPVTKAPTNAPVNVAPSPTKAPTNAPVNVAPSPTKAPTNAPINVAPSPTKTPTNAPVSPPTDAPVKPPTDAPCPNFVCPANSVRLPGKNCYRSFDDCMCDAGFTKENGMCASITFPIKINCGSNTAFVSPTTGTWIADAFFAPGSGFYGVGNPIDGTEDDGLYQTERNSVSGPVQYAIPVLATPAKYTVTLHFAELFQDNVGVRKFDVNIEGDMAFDDIDLFKIAGKFKKVTKTKTVSVTDGSLNIDLIKIEGADNTAIVAIEVSLVPQTAPLGTPAPVPAPVALPTNAPVIPLIATFPFRVTVGGAYNGVNAWASDAAYLTAPGGLWLYPDAVITETPDEGIYERERYGAWDKGYPKWSFPVENGVYDVVLHFAEHYVSNIGERKFSVALEKGVAGKEILTGEIDIIKLSGAKLKAHTIPLSVEVTDSTLNIELLAGAIENPTICAIEIKKPPSPVV